MTITRSLIGLALVMGAATPAAAQERALRDRTVPLELVEALLASRVGQTAPVVLVGELPPQMKSRVYVPANARILGGMSSSANATGVFTTSEDPAALRRDFVREAAARGWKEFEPASGVMGGFRDVSRTGPLVYCDGGVMTQITIGPGAIGESRVTIFETGEGACNFMRNQPTRMGPDILDNLKWPTLLNPETTRSGGECGFARRPSFSQPAELTTRMTPDSLLSHYGKQLEELGYAPAPNLQTRSWLRTDPTGAKMLLELTVQVAEGSPCRRMHMRTSAWR